jgi:hypothetical protein
MQRMAGLRFLTPSDCRLGTNIKRQATSECSMQIRDPAAVPLAIDVHAASSCPSIPPRAVLSICHSGPWESRMRRCSDAQLGKRGTNEGTCG